MATAERSSTRRVFVTRRIPDEGLERLRAAGAGVEVVVNPHDRVLTRQELLDGVREADVLLCLLTDRIDAEVMDAGRRLVGISNYAVGFDNVDVEAATRRGLPVSNTPGVLTETTADFAWALLMAVARRVVEGDRMMRAGQYDGWGPMLLLGTDVYGKTLGLVGLGRIGRAVARRARGFDMRVLYFDPQRLPASEEQAVGVSYCDLDTLLEASDFVSIHVPLLPETRHLIGGAQFARMKRTAYLINTARGPIVDESALVAALRQGVIAGAALDVYEHEPQVAPGLAELPNVVLAPHIASASRETRGRMAAMAAENALAMLRGQRPPSLVNPEAYAHPREVRS